MAEIHFDSSLVASADLIVGAIYEGGPGLADEPIHKLIGTGNMGGIRARKGKASDGLIALFSTEDQPEWPDKIDRETGVLTYFGDNRTGMSDLLDPSGNQHLHTAFRRDLAEEKNRVLAPVFFVFTKAENAPPRSVRFEGLAVPGSYLPDPEWAVAKWFTEKSGRFQNYVIQVTLLADRVVNRSWVEDLIAGDGSGQNAPANWRHWVETGVRTPLISA
jgi:hypothetical protein